MNDHHDHHDIVVPRGALIAVGLLIFFTISAVALFRLTGQEPAAQVQDAEFSILSSPLLFEDGDDGSVIVFEARDDQPAQVIHRVKPGEGGFIRGVLRSLSRARRARDIGPEHPFLLQQQSNGTLVLEDPQTGQRIDLRAFGPTNIESFRDMLDSNESLR